MTDGERGPVCAAATRGSMVFCVPVLGVPDRFAGATQPGGETCQPRCRRPFLVIDRPALTS